MGRIFTSFWSLWKGRLSKCLDLAERSWCWITALGTLFFSSVDNYVLLEGGMIIFLRWPSKGSVGFQQQFPKIWQGFCSFNFNNEIRAAPWSSGTHQASIVHGPRRWHWSPIFHPWPGANRLACGTGVSSAQCGEGGHISIP